MPDDSGGNFTLVASYKAEPGQLIRTVQHNPVLEDIASSMTARLRRDGSSSMVGNLNMNSFRIINLAEPRFNNDAVRRVDLLLASPVGMVIDFAGDIAPVGWLICAGQAVSRTDFSELFAIIGVKFGPGDGVSTFNVPDLRGRIVAGIDNMGGTSAARLSTINSVVMGTAGGSQTHVLTIPELAVHNHTGTALTAGAHNHTGNVDAGGEHTHTGTAADAGAHSHGGGTNSGGEHTHAGDTSSAGAHNHTVDMPIAVGAGGGGGIVMTPGLNGTFLQGVATLAGAHTHNFTTNAAGAHTHVISSDGEHTHTISTSTAPAHQHVVQTDGAHTHEVTTVDVGGAVAHNNIQPTMVMNKIIRVK